MGCRRVPRAVEGCTGLGQGCSWCVKGGQVCRGCRSACTPISSIPVPPQLPAAATLALRCMDGVFLSPNEDEFVGRITEELEHFMLQGQHHRWVAALGSTHRVPSVPKGGSWLVPPREQQHVPTLISVLCQFLGVQTPSGFWAAAFATRGVWLGTGFSPCVLLHSFPNYFGCQQLPRHPRPSPGR